MSSIKRYIRERLVGDVRCAVPAQTQTGSVCGTLRTSYGGRTYASFRGVPYARQPLGHLRFDAPQPADSWEGFFNASVEGPVCPQRDRINGPMMQPRSMGEDCLHGNVHVPAASLPEWGKECGGSACLPVVVFLHGGVFYSGSGDSDLNGPEYLMDKDVVLITFNYRLGAFGYLSLNTSSVPGNAALRDRITALQWVQTNARSFGGDPGRVTLMGHSSGAADAHILSLSEAANGLFHKLVLLSSTATSGYFSPLPSYAQDIKNSFLKQLGINSNDPDEILSQLIALPSQALVDANDALLESTGFAVFGPVIESQFEGVTRILVDDPDVLVANGIGSNYPVIVGFANNECASMMRTLEQMDVVEKIKNDTKVLLPAKLLNSVSPEEQSADAQLIRDRYIKGTPSLQQYLPACADSLFVYSILKLAETRLRTGGAPFYLYQLSYSSPSIPIKLALGIEYEGAGHIDALTYILRVNSVLKHTVLSETDEAVKNRTIDIIANFLALKDLDDSLIWPRLSSANGLQYQNIGGPNGALSPLTGEQREMIAFFDRLYGVIAD